MTSSYKSHIAFILVYALWPTENSAMTHRLKTISLVICIMMYEYQYETCIMTSLYKFHIAFILIYDLWPTENSAMAHRLKTTDLD